MKFWVIKLPRDNQGECVRGHRPGTAEAIGSSSYRAGRPTQEAFTFRQAFPAPDAQQ
jgi:hypothetical protein